MSIGVILGVIFFGIAVAVFGYGVHLRSKKKQKKAISVFVTAGVFALLLVFIPFSFHTVEAGEVAVVKHLGEAREVRTAGTYFDFWITEKYEKYDAKVQSLEVTTQAYSKDAQTMDIAMTVQYKISTEKEKVIEIANVYGSIAQLTNRIQSIATEQAKSILSSYSAMEIIETRSEISPQVEHTIKTKVDDTYCIDIVAVVLTNIDFSDAFEQTVEDKMIAEQEKLKAEYEKETAIINAEKELEVAKLAAEAKLEAAKADAQAQVEIARAEATAIQLKSVEVARALGFTITETLVENEDGTMAVEYVIDFEGKSVEEIKLITDYLKYIEYLAKWNGELPEVVAGDSATIMIPTPDGDADETPAA